MFPNLHVCWHKCTHTHKQMQLREKMGIEANEETVSSIHSKRETLSEEYGRVWRDGLAVRILAALPEDLS